MRASTLFRAYERAQCLRRVARYDYGVSKWGIAVASTPPAKRWQRYDRLVEKLAVRLIDILEEYDKRTTP